MKQTIRCLVQNRLGALDRVLGALTYRGFIPECLVCAQDAELDCMEFIAVVECLEEKSMEKLVKFLEKQVYVLSVQRFAHETERQLLPPLKISQANVEPLYISVETQRRSHYV